ncbi:MAG: hypothetical protein M3164_05235 [Actinomycetota bacterium]|nr:hypothetical protein [Actinomycetota bacterium]
MPGGRPEQPPAVADFRILEANASDPRDRPEANQRAAEAAGIVKRLVDEYYATAFVDPSRWADGRHEPIAALFTGEARPHVAPNLGGLALADLAPRLERVSPTRQEAKIRFLAEDDLSLPIGVVATAFEADGTTRERAEGPVKIVHHATFWLVREPDGYRISAFQAELRADTATQAAAFGGGGG